MISNTFYAGGIACETEKAEENQERFKAYGQGLAKLYAKASVPQATEESVPGQVSKSGKEGNR